MSSAASSDLAEFSRRTLLDSLVRPKSIAIVGATEATDSVGRMLVANALASPFGHCVHAVNPKRSSVLGLPCVARLVQLSEAVELAMIAVPAGSVEGVIDECVAAGVRAAVVYSAGFRETGAAGAALEDRIRQRIEGTGLRVVGPNCLGVLSPVTGLNASFAADMPSAGQVGFISQSGALLTAILDWSLVENVGFSHVFSIGSMLDVGWGDLIDALGDDPATHSILLYMESLGDARGFLSAAREVALQKPIIVVKAGRTETAAKAAMSHTGALAGSDDALDAAFRRAGVLRVNHVSELFSLAEILAKQPRPKGPNLAIVTNAGGPGVLATDALVEAGGRLATLSTETVDRLSTILPAHWSHANPIDVLGDADADRFIACLEVIAQAPECDAILAILTPQAMTEPTRVAERLTKWSRRQNKPVLASWMGGARVAEGVRILNRAGIPTMPYADAAARTFQQMWQHADQLRLLYETPSLAADEEDCRSIQHAETALQEVAAAGRTLLTEVEAKEVLAGYGIPVVPTRFAASAREAVQTAREIGYPVVLKLHSATITHKSDVRGVRLGLTSDDQVARAFDDIRENVDRLAGPGHFDGVSVQRMVPSEGCELIVGSSVDAQLGPIVLFGWGGRFVEAIQDRALALPPLNSTLARRVVERTKVYSALQSPRGQRAIDLSELEHLLVRFASMVVEQPRIREIDINPLLADETGLLAVDARVVLHPGTVADQDLPRSVIRPYPRQYVSAWETRDGRSLSIRPIRPEDESLLAAFHASLTDDAVYARYGQVLPLGLRAPHERLSRMCFIDYDRQIALVAIDQPNGDARICAVARLIKLTGSRDAEFAIVVGEAHQRQGLGTELMQRLAAIARHEGVARMLGYVAATNWPMLDVCRRLGFRFAGNATERMAIYDL